MIKQTLFIFSLIISCQLHAQETNIDTAIVKHTPIFHRGINTEEYYTLYFWSRKDGLNELYYPDGKIYLKGNYYMKKDSSFIKNGVFHYFYKNGNTKKIGTYKNNKEISTWNYFDSTEVQLYQIEYDSNTKTYFHPNGNKSGYGKFKITKAGHESRYGLWIFFHENGKVNCKGKLTWTGKVGEWNYYDNLGQKTKSINYPYQRFKKYRSINVNHEYKDICECK